MVNVTDGTNVYMGLCSFKFAFAIGISSFLIEKIFKAIVLNAP